MSERFIQQSEYLSELYHLKNYLVAQLTEVDRAIMREKNVPNALKQNGVTEQTHELLDRAKGILKPQNGAKSRFGVDYEALAENMDKGSMHVKDKSNYRPSFDRAARQAIMQEDHRGV